MRKAILISACLFSFKTIRSQNFSDSLLNKFIQTWIGTPYRFGGKSNRGIDCSQLNKKLYEYVYKISLPNICKEQYSFTERIKFDDLKKGDLLFFNSNSSPSGWHCGVYIGDEKFIHASNRKTGVIVSNIKEKDYRRRFKSGGRVF